MICSLSPIKTGVLFNGVEPELKREFNPLPKDNKFEFFFFGTATYLPNFLSLKYFLKNYWTSDKSFAYYHTTDWQTYSRIIERNMNGIIRSDSVLHGIFSDSLFSMTIPIP